MTDCLIVGAGGAAGSVLRYLAGLIPLGAQSGFPIKTLLINVAGAFAIGLIAAVSEKSFPSPHLILFLKTGLCGGFTTFSTFALETNLLIREGNYAYALLYVFLSVVLSIAAVFSAQVLAS